MTASGAQALQVGGTLRSEHLYIRRPEDAAVFEVLVSGEFCNVLTSRQMGKSSLMVRVMRRLSEERGARLATVDMAGDLGKPEDAYAWYSSFVRKIADDLDLDDDMEAWWLAAKGTPNDRLLRFFREVIGEQIKEAVFIFVDEIDATLNLPYSDDFFTALRSMYNQRAIVPQYKRITFCMLGVASRGELIKARRTTPYNIGRSVELRDFDAHRDDFSELIRILSEGGARGEERLDAILGWTGGHPFLTIALSRMVIEADLRSEEEIARIASSIIAPSADEGSPNLMVDQLKDEVRAHFEFLNRFVETRLHKEGAALRLYDSILRGRNVYDRGTLTQRDLRLSGLVKRDPNGLLVVRNRLYARRFGRAWLAQTKSMKLYTLAIRLTVGLPLLITVTWGAILYFKSKQDAEASRAAQVTAAIEAVRRAPDQDKATEARKEACRLIAAALVPSEKEKERDSLQDAWQSFWQQLATATDNESNKALRDGDVERGLVLAARASVERGELPGKHVRDTYEREGVQQLVATLTGHVGAVNRVRFVGPDRLVSIGDDETLRLFDIATGKEIKRQAIRGRYTGIDVCDDGSCVLTAVAPLRGDVWSADLERLASFTVDKPRRIYGLALGPRSATSALIAIGGERGATEGETDVVAVGSFSWSNTPPAAPSQAGDANAEPQRLTKTTFFRHATRTAVSPVTAVDLSPKGHKLVTAALDGVRLFDLTQPEPEGKFIYKGQAYDARFMAKGAKVVVAADEKMAVYETATGVQLQYRRGEHLTGAPSPDGKQIASATNMGDQGQVIVWRLEDERLDFYRLMASRARDAEWGMFERESVIATAHEDGKIRIWRLSLERRAETPLQLWQLWQRKFGVWEPTKPGSAAGELCPE